MKGTGARSGAGAAPLAALVGATLGAGEAMWVVCHTRSVSTAELALLFCYASAGYGLAAAVVTAGIARARRGPHRRTDPVAVATGTFLALQCICGLTALARPALAWLIPACIMCGAAGGWLVHAFAQRVAAARAPAVWALLFAGFLVGATVVAGMRRLESTSVQSTRTPNILLISVDTLRSDRLGCYGRASARTPHIDAFANEGALFEHAATPIPLTGPAHTTMLTGLYPVHHGAQTNGIALRREVATVPEILASAGYRTAAFVSGWTLKDAAAGLARRFAHYDQDFARWGGFPDLVLDMALPRLAVRSALLAGIQIEPLERSGAHTTDRALVWLAEQRGRPFFAFVHYFDAHAPYCPPPPYDTLHDRDNRGAATPCRRFLSPAAREAIVSDPRSVAHMQALYAGSISYVDEQIGRLLSGLAKLGASDSTVVIFTADHGESLTEHGTYFDHGDFLYETCLHVPLIIRFPDRRFAGTRLNGLVRLTDLAPTMLDLAEITRRPALDGSSLLPLLTGVEPPGRRVSPGAIHLPARGDARARYAVHAGHDKLIWNFGQREDVNARPATEELYDLDADPGEEHNLIAGAPPVLEPLRRHMQAWREEQTHSRSAPSESVQERLRALGY